MEKESKALKSALTGKSCDKDIYKVQLKEPTLSSKEISASSYPKGSYFVQVGSFSQEDGAQKLAAQLDIDSNIYYFKPSVHPTLG